MPLKTHVTEVFDNDPVWNKAVTQIAAGFSRIPDYINPDISYSKEEAVDHHANYYTSITSQWDSLLQMRMY